MSAQPIKRNENLIPISREHHGTLLFCWKLKQGLSQNVEQGRIVHYINWYMADHIQPHFETEERYLFVEKEDSLVSKALEDHQHIKDLVVAINAQHSSEDVKDLILQVSNAVNEHTRYEERILFPHLEQHFDAAHLSKIGEALSQEEHNAEEKYEDEFWVIKK